MHVSVLRKIYCDLREHNPLAQELQEIGAAADVLDVDRLRGPQVTSRLENHVPFFEVAAITSDTETRNRVIKVKMRGGKEASFGMKSRYVEPLCYPVLFPNGESGWGEGTDDYCTFYQYLASRILQPEILPTFETMKIYSNDGGRSLPVSRFQVAARVMSVYLVDMVSRAIDYRLQWMKKNQATIFGGTRYV